MKREITYCIICNIGFINDTFSNLKIMTINFRLYMFVLLFCCEIYSGSRLMQRRKLITQFLIHRGVSVNRNF